MRFDPQALTSLTEEGGLAAAPPSKFRSTGSYEPDQNLLYAVAGYERFRSTGSYEPDRYSCIYPGIPRKFRSTGSYEPDPNPHLKMSPSPRFRSTGSYEPDRDITLTDGIGEHGFDPQALTSLTINSM